MSDFHSMLETPEEPRKTDMEPRRTPDGVPGFSPLYRGRTPEAPGASPGPRRTPGRGSTSIEGKGAEPRRETLLVRADHLNKEAERVYQISAAAEAVQAPFATAFWNAHGHLLDLHMRRSAGSAVGKQTMMAAYDARMLAGHAWNPWRKKYQSAQRWLKEIRKELLAVNTEIEGRKP